MIYSIIHYPYNEGKKAPETIIYTTTNITQALSALEEFAIHNLEKRCGLETIQKGHPSQEILNGKRYYAISKLHKIEIYKIAKGWIYNSRLLCDEYKIIRCTYMTFNNKKKMKLKPIDPELLIAIRARAERENLSDLSN